MRKYLTAAIVSAGAASAGRWKRQQTYGCRLAAGQRHCLAAGSAGRPDLVKRSLARQNVPEAGASGHGGRMDTWCAATGSCVRWWFEGSEGPTHEGPTLGRCGSATTRRGNGSSRTCQDRKRKSVRLCLKGVDNKTREREADNKNVRNLPQIAVSRLTKKVRLWRGMRNANLRGRRRL